MTIKILMTIAGVVLGLLIPEYILLIAKNPNLKKMPWVHNVFMMFAMGVLFYFIASK